MKRLMILGAGDAQYRLITESLKQGYYTIVCDKRPEMEGAKAADRFYPIDYMNLDEVYEIAKKEHIDGIISNSEPAMVNVAWISNKLHLVGNSAESIEMLVSKSDFRQLQRRIGVFSPEHYAVNSCEELLVKARSMVYPLIIKPTESCGTQGTTRIDEFDEKIITETYYKCKEFSRNGKVSIEKYVPMNSLRVIECEVFVFNDTFLWDGMISTYRSEFAPMVPMTYVYPADIPEESINIVTRTIKKVMKETQITFGEFNVEAYFTQEGELFIIEINPRQGGYKIPEMIEACSGVDYSRLLVSLAVGDQEYWDSLVNTVRTGNPFLVHVVYGRKTGVFSRLVISENLKNITYVEYYVKPGQRVSSVRNLFDAIALCVMRFDSIEERNHCFNSIEQLIYAEID